MPNLNIFGQMSSFGNDNININNNKSSLNDKDNKEHEKKL